MENIYKFVILFSFVCHKSLEQTTFWYKKYSGEQTEQIFMSKCKKKSVK